MFKTFQGILEDNKNTIYLRPETAQGMFVNFKKCTAFYAQKNYLLVLDRLEKVSVMKLLLEISFSVQEKFEQNGTGILLSAWNRFRMVCLL